MSNKFSKKVASEKKPHLSERKLLKNMKENGLGYETRNSAKIMLVDMFNKALIDDFVRKNPAKGITRIYFIMRK